MEKNTRKQKLKTIENQLKILICFSAEEVSEYMKNVRDFSDEGLDAFLEFLNGAQEKQDAFFAENIKRDPEFVKTFSRFLTKTSNKIKKRVEIKEQGKAEKILKNIS